MSVTIMTTPDDFDLNMIGVPVAEEVTQLHALRVDELLSLDVKPRAQLLAPVLPEKGLVMLYGPRGIGKTHVALSMAYAVAAGGKVFGWSAPAPRSVLYIDGEMPLATIQERMRGTVIGSEAQAEPENFQILAADYFPDGLPNLATREGQAAIDHLIEGKALVVLDNVSTLATFGKDNDAESWTPVQAWLLSLRRRGISVLLVHHAGKAGQQRGTSRREDVLDTVIALRRCPDYNPTEGARFEVHLEKARGVHGDDAKSFEARLEIIDGGVDWAVRDLADAEAAMVLGMHADGMSLRDIAQETGIPKSTVARMLKRVQPHGGQAMISDALKGDCPTVPTPRSGTVGQLAKTRDSEWDSRGTVDLKALARKGLKRDSEWDSKWDSPKNTVPRPSDPWDSSGGAVPAYPNVPKEWVDGFAQLDASRPPAGYPLDRWRLALRAGEFFMATGVAAQAARLGWHVLDVFGLHRKAPAANLSAMGLIFVLGSGKVVAMTAERAIIESPSESRLTFTRMPLHPEAAPAWSLLP